MPEESGLLLDWGGVMTTSLFDSFAAFCLKEGLSPDALGEAFRRNPEATQLLVGIERGKLAEVEFETRLAAIMGVEPRNLIGRMFAGAQLDAQMVEMVRAARAQGVRTGLVSNSWGTSRYPSALLAELFDGVVISGEVGIRKPSAAIYKLGAQRIQCAPEHCIFVDDLAFNLDAAQELGMGTVLHLDSATTIAQLEQLLKLTLVTPPGT